MIQLKRRLSTGTHATDAAEAQCTIDAEIAAHKAAIGILRSRRNTHSSISKLPSEIFVTIFLLVKVGMADWVQSVLPDGSMLLGFVDIGAKLRSSPLDYGALLMSATRLLL